MESADTDRCSSYKLTVIVHEPKKVVLGEAPCSQAALRKRYFRGMLQTCMMRRGAFYDIEVRDLQTKTSA